MKDPSKHPISFKGHERSVNDVAFSPDGRWLVSSSDDLTVRLWDLQGLELSKTQDLVESIVFEGHRASAQGVDFNTSGSLLASAGSDGNLRLWLVRPEPLVDALCERTTRNLTWPEWKDYLDPQIPISARAPTSTCPDLCRRPWIRA